MAFFRFVAAASAVASKVAAVPAGTPLVEQPWILTTLLAVAGYLLWETAGAVGDHKHKLGKDKAKADSEREIEELERPGGAHGEVDADALRGALDRNVREPAPIRRQRRARQIARQERFPGT